MMTPRRRGTSRHSIGDRVRHSRGVPCMNRGVPCMNGVRTWRRLSRLLRFLCVPPIALSVLAATVEAQPARRHHPNLPILERTIGDGEVELYRPYLLATSDSGLVFVFDAGDMQVRAFSTEGQELWNAGRKGRGPREFSGAEDLKTDANGAVVVLDNTNRRITRISPGGIIEQMTALPANTIGGRVLPLPSPNVFIVPTGTDLMAMEVAPTGTSARTIRYPEQVVFKTTLAGESYTVRVPNGAVLVFRWSSTIVVLESDGAVSRIIDGVGPTPFPEARSYPAEAPGIRNLVVTRVDPTAKEWARSAAAHQHHLYVLSAELSRQGGSVLDVYDLRNGLYVGSYDFPKKQHQIALLPDGRIVTLELGLLPVVRIWTLPQFTWE